MSQWLGDDLTELVGNYQYENTVLSYYISTLLLCVKPNLSHAIIACTVIMYYYNYTVIIPTGKWSYQERNHHIRIIPGILFSRE